jgi:hypothetical protein
MKTRRLLCLAVLLALTGSPLAAAQSNLRGSREAKPAATIRRPVSPLDSANQLDAGYQVGHRYGDANCESGSPTTGTSYSCFASGSPDGVFDSCWVRADTSFAICVVKPWMHKVVQLHVSRGYDDANGFLHVQRPWGIRLGQDTRCLVILGPVHSTGGHTITYYCNHRTVLAGSVQRRSPTWRVRAYRRRRHHKRHQSPYKSLGWQPVAIAWSGKPSQRD